MVSLIIKTKLSTDQKLNLMYCAVQKNSVPAAAGSVATSHTVFLLNIVIDPWTIYRDALKGEHVLLDNSQAEISRNLGPTFKCSFV